MDVDPKPMTPPPAPSAESATGAPITDIAPGQASVASVTNPLVADALTQELSKDQTGTSSPSPVIGKPKKSRRTLIIVGVIVIVLIIAGLAWYVFWGVPSKTTASTTPVKTTQQTTTPATASTNNATIDNATSSMESSASNEATASSTDDSTAATDASTTAGNVGSSVDENSF